MLLLPGDTMAVSCGGNTIKIWDLTSGGKRLTTVSPHHKTITALCLADGGQSIVSSSLDRQVSINIFYLELNLVHGALSSFHDKN